MSFGSETSFPGRCADVIICVGHITLSALPMIIFGPISLAVYIYATILDLFSSVVGKPTVNEAKMVSGIK